MSNLQCPCFSSFTAYFYNYSTINELTVTLETILPKENFIINNSNVSLRNLYRALVESLLYLSLLSTLVVQSLMMPCIFGWRT